MNPRLLIETTFIFLLPPLLIIAGLLPKAAVMPLLWLGMFYALGILRHNGYGLLWHFDFTAFLFIFKRFLLFALLLGALIWALAPELLFSFPKSRPELWLMVMVLYPILSALAQEIIYRGLFVFRFEAQIHPRMLLVVNALVFAYIHAVFGNVIAVVLSFLGALMFAGTYLKTRSVTMSSIEHALYGDFIFTIGIGHYFYHGAQ